MICNPAQKLPQGLLLSLLGLFVLFALLIGGLVLIPRYRAAHPSNPLQRSDADSVQVEDLYLDVTLVTPGFRKSRKLDRFLGDRDPETILPLLVGLNTHTGTIEHLRHLGGNFTLVGPHGDRYPALADPLVLSEHHNAYMVLFPSKNNYGEPFMEQTAGTLTLEVAGLGAEPLRQFAWSLPLQDAPSHSSDLLATAMLLVAFLGALIVVLSPCALELTLYYSAIISCSVAEATGGAAGSKLCANPAERRRLLLNLGSFVLGFTLLYAVSGATVGLIGEGVRQPLGEYGRLLQILGGSLILFFALRVLGLDRRIRAGLAKFVETVRNLAPSKAGAVPRREIPNSFPSHAARKRGFFSIPGFLGRLRFRGLSNSRQNGRMKARDSFLVGMGLSSSCVTCMGGSILYPLLVYAGITSWYWGLLTLGLYSLGIAVPMIFIALGFYEIRLSLEKRVRLNRSLRWASGAMLAGIAALFLSGQERILADVTFGMLGTISRWFV